MLDDVIENIVNHATNPCIHRLRSMYMNCFRQLQEQAVEVLIALYFTCQGERLINDCIKTEIAHTHLVRHILRRLGRLHSCHDWSKTMFY